MLLGDQRLTIILFKQTKLMLAKFLSTSLLFSLSLNIFAQSTNKFSKAQVIEDLTYLYESLQDAHYDVYAYVTKEKFKAVYEQLKHSVNKDSLSLLEANLIFQRLSSAVNNGHTEIDFPKSAYSQYAYAGGTLFPLEIAFEEDKSLIRKNFSQNKAIKTGSEIISINGESIDAILTKIYPLISAERPYFKKVKIEVYSFPRCYWLAYGRQDKFEVKIRSNETITTYLLDAVDLIQGFEMKRSEVLNAAMNLAFFDASAYLNPGNFDGDKPKFQQFIDSAFAVINEKGSKNLIIDFRNNGGGNDSYSDYLVSYIANQPFRWNSKFTLKTSQFLKAHTRKNSDTTSVYFQNILSRKDGEIYEYEFDEYQPQPTSKRFNGKVYILVNRQSNSQAAVTAAQIQDYKFGTIVGEETGEYPSLYASQFKYPLPNTGIISKVSKGFIVRVNGETKGQGVMPDIFIKDHLLDEDDEILKTLLKQLKEQKGD